LVCGRERRVEKHQTPVQKNERQIEISAGLMSMSGRQTRRQEAVKTLRDEAETLPIRRSEQDQMTAAFIA